MSNEKKGNGFFGKIKDAIQGNEQEQTQNTNADNGAVNDATADQNEKAELKSEEVVISKEATDQSHLKPQSESKDEPKRPEAIKADHLKPQKEVDSEKRKVKVADPKHLKPQE